MSSFDDFHDFGGMGMGGTVFGHRPAIRPRLGGSPERHEQPDNEPGARRAPVAVAGAKMKNQDPTTVYL
jgi:hypothetical protein